MQYVDALFRSLKRCGVEECGGVWRGLSGCVGVWRGVEGCGGVCRVLHDITGGNFFGT